MRIVLLVLVSLALPSGLLAQHGRQAVVAGLDATARQTGENGFRADTAVFPRGELIGRLAEGTASYVEVWLQEGGDYFFAGACSDECADLDLRLVPIESLDAIAEDAGNDSYPMFRHRPEAAGPYLLAVEMASCRRDPCYYGVRVFRR